MDRIAPLVGSIIDGEAVVGERRAAVIFPADESQVGELAEADADEVAAAVAAARRAFAGGPWCRMAAAERSLMLGRIADIIDAHADELALLECMNTGLPMARLKTFHMPRAAWNFRFFAEVASQASGDVYDQDPRYLTMVTRAPVGVAALISPWNAPVPLSAMKIAAAIAFGNSCVLKPSELTPLALHRLVELIHEAGLPPGVVNLVNGRGDITGAALVAHDEVDLVSFTGGTETGRRIAAMAGQRLVPTTMELGGKSANIVFADADLDAALDGALKGIFSNNGQQCIAGSRILVQHSIADEFIARFVERASKLRIGDPRDVATDLGPLISRDHMERVLSFAQTDGGERLLTGGRRAAGFDAGFFIQPTAILAQSTRTRAARDEIFGPFATFLLFDTAEEALSIANDSRYGLASYVWTRDMQLGLRCAREIEAGLTWVNTPMMRELRAPFGGWKQSGIGAEGGRACLDFYTRQKTTTIGL